MGDVAAVATAVTSVSTLVDGILSRADRDALQKEEHELTVELQNAFANNELDTDKFRLWIDKLLNLTGNPLTPTGDTGTGRRELLHALLVNSIKLVHERRLAARAVHTLMQK
jgi:hypothetical protein